MEFIEDQKYTLPVVAIGVLIDRGRSYLTVEFDDRQYQVLAYNFQKANPPKELQCIFKGGKLRQDRESLLPQIYKQGEVYNFRVLSEKNAGMQILIDDKESINHKLPVFNGATFKRGSMVKCRVDGFEPGYLKLTVIEGEEERRFSKFTLKDICSLAEKHSIEARLLARMFERSDAMAPAREEAIAGNPRWVMTAIEIFETELPGWVTMRYRHLGRIIEAFIEISTRLLEKSDYLMGFSDSERYEARNRIARTITYAGDYLEALRLQACGAAEEFVVSAVTSLLTTGYIYQPERKMRIVMALLGIEPAIVRTYITDIFNVILSRHGNPSFMKLFSNAFIEMLDIYITGENRYTGFADKGTTSELIKAIAILLLLTSDIDFPRWGLYRAMLYRNASMFNKGDIEKSRRLIEKAFDSLLDRCDSRLEFSWKDLENITMLCTTKLTALSDTECARISAEYDGSGVNLRMEDSSIIIGRSDNPEGVRNVLPPNFLPDRDIQLHLPRRLEERVTADECHMTRICRMWDEVTETLLEKTSSSAERRDIRCKQRPSVGDELTIRVTGKRPDTYPTVFECVVEDPIYEGVGTISIVDIVGYNVKADTYTFTSGENEQLLLKASVSAINDDESFTFSMRNALATFIFESALDFKERGEVLRGVITDAERNPGYYLGLADDGFTFSISKTGCPPLSKGADVEFEINFAGRDNKKRDTNIIVNGNLIRVVDECENLGKYCEQAMNHLLYDYAQGQTYVEPDEVDIIPTREADTFLYTDEVYEVIRLVDSLSKLHPENHAVTYGYLAIARLLTLMVSDTTQERNFKLRMDLLKAITDYADTGRVDGTKLEELSDRVDAGTADSSITYLMVELRALSLLGAPWDECGYLNEIAHNSENISLASLARQVLAYNLLQGIHQTATERKNLKQEILSMLNLRSKSIDTVIPKESDVVELKTSLIYPAGGHMHADEARQVKEIMEEICGFLNTSGGTLYVGVRDNGNISGLHQDFTYLNDNFEDYDIVDVQDKFKVRFANGITRHFGSTNNGVNLSAEHIRGDFDYINGKWIFVITVKPSPNAVAMTGGEMFVRLGNTNRRIQSEEERRLFAENRATEFISKVKR